jgi:hypothetical protein
MSTRVEDVATQPVGGGALPRIPVVKADAERAARRLVRTLHETRADLRVGRATASQEPALDDAHPTGRALVTKTFPTSVMTSPFKLLAGLRPAICFASGYEQSGKYFDIGYRAAVTIHANAMLNLISLDCLLT